MSSIAPAASIGSAPSEGSQGLAQASFLPERGQNPFIKSFIDQKVAYVLVKYLSAETICAFTKVNQSCSVFCNATPPKSDVPKSPEPKSYALKLKELQYKDRLLNQLLPGMKEEQLPLNLITYGVKTKEVEWEKAYKAILPLVYGPAFFKSIGIRTVPSRTIPQGLLEKKYLPTHTIEIPANSTLGLTRDGRLTNGPQNPEDPNDPDHYAPENHRHFRRRLAGDAEGLRRLQFPNTKTNRDFLEANPDLHVAPYPMQSPLEQGSPLIDFQEILEIDVPEGSLLRATSQGVLTDKPGMSWNHHYGFGDDVIPHLKEITKVLLIRAALVFAVGVVCTLFSGDAIYVFICLNTTIPLIFLSLLLPLIVRISFLFINIIYPIVDFIVRDFHMRYERLQPLYLRWNKPAVNGIKTIRFLNTPHNWQTLSRPVLHEPSRVAGPDNPYIAKYLSANAKPVEITAYPEIKEIWDTPVQPKWHAPAAGLVARGGTYLQLKAEAQQIRQNAVTFHQNSIHRILSLIRGNPVSRPSWENLTAQSRLWVFEGEGSTVPSRVDMRKLIDVSFNSSFPNFASAWDSAENP
jgi:hypothetical protein